MSGSFGLLEPGQSSRFPAERLVELRSQVDLKQVNRGRNGGRRPAHDPDILIDGIRVRIVRDQRNRRWFACPRCARGCRILYRDPEFVVACRLCCKLEYSSRHLYRSLPSLHRVIRLRRQLGIDPRPFTAIPKPKQRLELRWRRVVARILVEEQVLRGHLQKINRDLDRRARVRGWCET